MRLIWNAEPGMRYQVQMSVDLKSWADVGEPRVAASASDALAVNLNQPAAFFRVIRLP